MNQRAVLEVAEKCAPGTIEARHVHGCTCGTEFLKHARTDAAFVVQDKWDPEHPSELWQALLQADCPAHAHLRGRSA